ncbi:BRCT domain-containing protein [Artemisia annua]|uniref:BRCT domain-containing protein n=1 Tax=Artemisia annua TaxID=35608 RepID=A0A2U1PIY2_ARTAN|nr:BRCT domain-containing protein [Artemisia annua]
MEESQRLLNPWLLHVQKLGLELKCPLCDVGRGTSHCPASCKMEVNDKKENVEIAQEGNSSNGQSVILNRCDKLFGARKIMPERIEKLTETGADGVGFIQLEQLSPQFSSDSKEDGHSSDPSSRNRNSLKRPIDKDAFGTKLESNSKPTSEANYQTTEAKRRKKTNDASNDVKMEVNGHLKTNETAFENAASVSCHSESEKPQLNLKMSPCVFCHSSKKTEGTGPLVCYAQGKEVKGDVPKFSKVTYVHEKCIAWSPQIYFKDEIIQNLESEIERANKLKCTSCGKKGAALGCYMNTCKRTYHVPCAYDIPDCRWECEEYLLLCPKHESQKFPSERKSKARKQDSQKIQLNPFTTSLAAAKTVVLCGSALSSDEKYSLVDFARGNGAVVSKCWRKDVTHVIAATDSTGACTRTLKVLMAILNGKWILTTEWLKACAKAGKLVDEEPYEVNLDTHGSSGGPKAGRLRVLNNCPKLFDNMKFYFNGDFVQAFKADLLNLITTAGGTIAETKMQLISSSNDADAEAKPKTVVVYNADYSDTYGFEDEASMKYQRLAAAEDVAQEFGSQIAGHTWILESIAACRVLPFTQGAA